MSRLFYAITICAALLMIAHDSTTKVPVPPTAGQMLIADGPLPPPDDPVNPPRSVEV